MKTFVGPRLRRLRSEAGLARCRVELANDLAHGIRPKRVRGTSRGGSRARSANAGYRAIETLRLEKGYRAWAADIGPEHTPDKAGLGWAVKMKTGIPFKGRAAGMKKIMATFTTEPGMVLSGRETIYRGGVRCGWLSSAGFGHSIGKSIGMGYVRHDAPIDRAFVLSGEYELDVATQRVSADVSLSPLFDPDMKKIKS